MSCRNTLEAIKRRREAALIVEAKDVTPALPAPYEDLL